MIKKLTNKAVLILTILTLFLSCFSGFLVKGRAEEKVITVYSWEDYMEVGEEGDITVDNDLLYQFEQETGIRVDYHTFATNEEMYNELIKNPDACDLVCPSEYMIMKMRDEGLLKPFTAPQNWVDNGSPYIKEVFDTLKINQADGKTYAVGYMWGTMGFLYNKDKVSAEELSSWKSIWNLKHRGKVTIKDSLRDSYIMTLGALYEEDLLAFKDKLANDSTYTQEMYAQDVFETFNKTDDVTIAEAEKLLKELKTNLYGFEVDSGKSDIIEGKIHVNFAWSGDAAYAISEADNLGYVVPEEGSNVWFDGWVMPKGANEEYASKFIDFISRPESAMRNMDYIGYVSCIAGDDVFNDYVKASEDPNGEYTLNLGYFFGGDNSVYSVKTDSPYGMLATQYPDEQIVNRCAVMDNFDSNTLIKLNEMWNRVKFITFPMWTLILIGAGVLLIIGGALVYKYRDNIFKPKERNKKGYKVIKEEVL